MGAERCGLPLAEIAASVVVLQMRPLPLGSGRLGLCRSVRTSSPSFNGAAPSRERKGLPARAQTARVHRLASMRPLPLGSGRSSMLVRGAAIAGFNEAAPSRERKGAQLQQVVDLPQP